MNWAYKAYDTLHVFKSKKAAVADATEWAMSTEGAERDRACRALAGFESGRSYVDTDALEA